MSYPHVDFYIKIWYSIAIMKGYIKLLKEYISLLERVNFEQSKALFNIGHFLSDRQDIEQGEALRKQIKILEEELEKK